MSSEINGVLTLPRLVPKPTCVLHFSKLWAWYFFLECDALGRRVVKG